MYLTELIGKGFKDWQGNDEVFIQTQTGSGKTTFILEELSLHAKQMNKEVLLLVNRKILKSQIKHKLLEEHGMEGMSDEEIEKIQSFEGITILSYQELQEELKRKCFPLGKLYEARFRYIVFDEAHYILQDATFNRNIYYLLAGIPKIQNATKVFMSATLENVYPFLWKTMHKDEEVPWDSIKGKQSVTYEYQETMFTRRKLIFYCMEPQFKVDNVKYIEQLEDIHNAINGDETSEKWLVFVNSKNEAEKLMKEIKKSQAYLDADVDEDSPVKQYITDQSRFQEKVLITTKVLDNGINLIDKDLKNIVLLTTEKTEFIQMLGRKRILNEKDSVRIYIMKRSVSYFNGMRNKQLLPAVEFIQSIYRDGRFDQKYLDDDESFKFCKKIAIIKDGCIEISKAAEEKIRMNLEFHNDIIEKLKQDSDAFIKEQLCWLDLKEEFEQKSYCKYEERKSCYERLCDYLYSMVGVEMEKADQVAFRENVNDLAIECGKILTDREGRIPGKAKINTFCKEEGITLQIKSIKNSSLWVVEGEKNEEE